MVVYGEGPLRKKCSQRGGYTTVHFLHLLFYELKNYFFSSFFYPLVYCSGSQTFSYRVPFFVDKYISKSPQSFTSLTPFIYVANIIQVTLVSSVLIRTTFCHLWQFRRAVFTSTRREKSLLITNSNKNSILNNAHGFARHATGAFQRSPRSCSPLSARHSSAEIMHWICNRRNPTESASHGARQEVKQQNSIKKPCKFSK